MISSMKFKAKSAALLLGGLSVLQLYAQQDPSYTHFAYNKLLYNPAYAGASNNFCLNAINQDWRGEKERGRSLRRIYF